MQNGKVLGRWVWGYKKQSQKETSKSRNYTTSSDLPNLNEDTTTTRSFCQNFKRKTTMGEPSSKDSVAELVLDYKSLIEEEKKINTSIGVGWRSKEPKEIKIRLQYWTKKKI